jgi:hypothetical protein
MCQCGRDVGVDVWLSTFISSALGRGEWPLSLFSRGKTQLYPLGGWVGPRASLDAAPLGTPDSSVMRPAVRGNKAWNLMPCYKTSRLNIRMLSWFYNLFQCSKAERRQADLDIFLRFLQILLLVSHISSFSVIVPTSSFGIFGVGASDWMRSCGTANLL